MAHEILPVESQGPLTPYQELVHQQIVARGDDNRPPIDRFSTKAAPVRDYDYSHSPDGEILFGDAWQTHHLDIEEFQIVYALKRPTLYKRDPWFECVMQTSSQDVSAKESATPMPVKAEFDVYEFGDAGVLSHTSFTEQDGIIHKSRTGGAPDASGFRVVEVQGELGVKKQATLEAVIAEPEACVVALRSLITLTRSEERQARKAHREHAAREREHAAIMEDISRAPTITTFPHPVC